MGILGQFEDGQDRRQAMLLPPSIDAKVGPTHRVRLGVEVVERRRSTWAHRARARLVSHTPQRAKGEPTVADAVKRAGGTSSSGSTPAPVSAARRRDASSTDGSTSVCARACSAAAA